MEGEKLGIKDSKELLDLIFGLGGVVKEGLADGKLNAADLGLLMLVLPKLQPAFDGISNVDDEFKDLDAEEAKELIAHAAALTAGVFSEEELLAKINAGLKAVLSLYEFVKLL